MKKNQNRTFSFRALTAVFAMALIFAACSKSPNRSTTANDDFDTIGNDDGGTFIPDIDNTGDGDSAGSGSGGGVTEADKQAINAALQQNEALEPEADDSGLSAALAAEAKRLLAEERAGKDVAVQKMLLAGKMLQECAGRIAPLAPIPGQPLMGKWNGGGACAVSFDVGAHGGGGKYPVRGGTSGNMQADQQGKGAIQASPFSGNVTDSPKSGKGTLTHPTFFKSKAGTSPCSVSVALQTPTSPIPANYNEAMKQTGKCFRQTLILMSPAFDKMFKNMDPALAQMLQQRFLGIGK